jgi:hypothetical protein
MERDSAMMRRESHSGKKRIASIRFLMISLRPAAEMTLILTDDQILISHSLV